MYWRVRKSSVDQIVRQYAVHGLLAFSVLLNVIFVATRPKQTKDIPKDAKVNFDAFARTVTSHLLDTSFISYKDSTIDLLQGELAPNVVSQLKAQQTLAANAEDLAAQAKVLSDQRSVSAIRIDSVTESEQDANGLLPIDVRGIMVKHDETGATDPIHFHFKFLIGNRANPKDHTPVLDDTGKPLPMVAGFQDLSGEKDPVPGQ